MVMTYTATSKRETINALKCASRWLEIGWGLESRIHQQMQTNNYREWRKVYEQRPKTNTIKIERDGCKFFFSSRAYDELSPKDKERHFHEMKEAYERITLAKLLEKD